MGFVTFNVELIMLNVYWMNIELHNQFEERRVLSIWIIEVNVTSLQRRLNRFYW